jgi:hypothetical protein
MVALPCVYIRDLCPTELSIGEDPQAIQSLSCAYNHYTIPVISTGNDDDQWYESLTYSVSRLIIYRWAVLGVELCYRNGVGLLHLNSD